MTVVAFLPCRAGSVRVPDKNTRPFAADGRSLLDIKLQHLGAAESVDEIVVSSNDARVLEVAEAFRSSCRKVLVVDDRPDHLGRSETTTDELIRYVPTIVGAGHLLWTHVTSPFVTSAIYDWIVSEYFTALAAGHDSVMTGTRLQTFIYGPDGPMNFDRTLLKWPRTQTLPLLWEINSAAFMVERDLSLDLGDRIGTRPKILELSHESSFDIDTQSQFDLGVKLWSART